MRGREILPGDRLKIEDVKRLIRGSNQLLECRLIQACFAWLLQRGSDAFLERAGLSPKREQRAPCE
jgi:hypothetical protein